MRQLFLYSFYDLKTADLNFMGDILMQYSGIGGQAVIEGVMMRNEKRYAIACRREDGTMVVRDYHVGREFSKPFKRIPFVRGFFAFIDSLVIGLKVLNLSSEIYLDEDSGLDSSSDGAVDDQKSGNTGLIVTILSFAVGLILAFGLFTVLPSALAGFVPGIEHRFVLRAAIEGICRIAIFIGYLFLISRMKDIQRVFCYHGAEHKSINCIEADLPLDVEHVKTCPTAHRRCGTSFLFFVVIVSVIVGVFIRVDTLWLRVLIRLLLLPLVSGISYEILRLAGRSDYRWVRALSAPGLLLQKLTVKEPDDSMIECAIASVEAVFDWRSWQQETFGKTK